MKFFIRILGFAILFGLYIASEDLFVFLPFDPPPPCPYNEMHKTCLSNCSNCEQRGICIITECSKSGCDCIPHFVRVTPGGPCEPVNKCPIPECKENEVFRECGPICEKCGTLNCRVLHCEHKCYCKPYFKRNIFGECIPEEDCPPKKHCPRHEEIRDSGPEDEYCLHAPYEASYNAIINKTQCYCIEDHKRNCMGHCMNESYCPVIQCMNHEEYQPCPKKCNRTCRTYEDPNCVEDDNCYPGCFCPEGYLMNDFRICVRLEECPPGSNPYAPTEPPQIETPTPESFFTVVPESDENSTLTGTSVTESGWNNTESGTGTTEDGGITTEREENPTVSVGITVENILSTVTGMLFGTTIEETVLEDLKEEELPEDLPDEDIPTDVEASKSTNGPKDSTSTPLKRLSKGDDNNQNSYRKSTESSNPKTEKGDEDENQ